MVEEVLGMVRSTVRVAPVAAVSSILIFSRLAGCSAANHAIEMTACSPCSRILLKGARITGKYTIAVVASIGPLSIGFSRAPIQVDSSAASQADSGSLGLKR